MKLIRTPAIAILLVLPSCVQKTPTEKMDVHTDALFSYLAKRRSMNVLRAGGEQLGAFGSVYALLKPTTPSHLYDMARRGKPIEISPYDATGIDLPTFTAETTRYQVQSQLASEIGAELKAEIEQKGGDVEVFKKKLVNSNIRFKVSRISTYERPARKGFRGHDYTKEEIPEAYTAVFTPLEVLRITEFSYDRKSDDSLEGQLVANFIEGLEGDIRVKRANEERSELGFDGSRIIAIRPMVLADNTGR